ncbi:MAG: flagellar biosynthetic protein FliP, partial [Proteobacteria bacterium]|nr:flagellar biosynthetic protein FliP [Pseudomonadota bacterium]
MSALRDGARRAALLALAASLGCAAIGAAAQGLPAVTSTPGAGGAQTYSLTIQTLLFLTALTFIPAAVLMMTAFTRIVIVLSLLRQAIGTLQAPPNQVLIGLALFLTFFVMAPVFEKAYRDAYVPFSQNQIDLMTAAERGVVPFREFMLKQTRESDLALFVRLSN